MSEDYGKGRCKMCERHVDELAALREKVDIYKTALTLLMRGKPTHNELADIEKLTWAIADKRLDCMIKLREKCERLEGDVSRLAKIHDACCPGARRAETYREGLEHYKDMEYEPSGGGPPIDLGIVAREAIEKGEKR